MSGGRRGYDKVAEITAQRASGLISLAECTDMLRRLANQAVFNAAYADDPKSYQRWNAQQAAARKALGTLKLVGRHARRVAA